jgi:hypothetical protein
VAAWTDLPWPHYALEDLLQAQCHAVDVLPYDLLDIEPPPLSTVYVRQQARPRPVGRNRIVMTSGQTFKRRIAVPRTWRFRSVRRSTGTST